MSTILSSCVQRAREQMLREMRAKAAGERAPHNKLYRPEKDGLATTFAGFVGAALKIRDPYKATDDEREQIKKAHLLLAAPLGYQSKQFVASRFQVESKIASNMSVLERTITIRARPFLVGLGGR